MEDNALKRLDPFMDLSLEACEASFELAKPEELLQWKHIHEDLLNSITALGKLVNQQMLLKVNLLL